MLKKHVELIDNYGNDRNLSFFSSRLISDAEDAAASLISSSTGVCSDCKPALATELPGSASGTVVTGAVANDGDCVSADAKAGCWDSLDD